jgi:hypothetical protein
MKLKYLENEGPFQEQENGDFFTQNLLALAL